MRIAVCFIYDEKTSKWEVEVEGLDDPIEVKQAFNAVVLTCREPIRIGLDHRVRLLIDTPNTYRLEVAV